MNVRRLLPLAMLIATTALQGCGGGAGGILGGGGGGTCTPTSFGLTYPSPAGFTIAGQVNAASGCLASATVTTRAALSPLSTPAFFKTGAIPVVYLGLSFSATEYTNGLPSLSVTFPSSVPAAGHQYYLAHYTGAWIDVAGPVTPSGQTVSFPTSNGNTTFAANQEDDVVLYAI